MNNNQTKISQMTLKKVQTIDNYIFYLLLLIIGLMPLLVRGKVIEFISPQLSQTILFSGLKVDFFTYYKWVFILIITVGAVGLFLYKIYKYRYQIINSYINLPVITLLTLALLATLFAEYKYIAIVGMYDRHDGLIAFICSLLLFFIAANIKVEKKYLQWVVYGLGLVIVINTIMGVADFYGYELIKNKFIAILIVPASVRQAVSGFIMATLNNPNYVAGTGAILAIFFMSAVIFISEMKIRVISAILVLPAFCLVLVGLSTGGFLALIVTGVMLIVTAVWFKGWKSLIPIVLLTMACSGIFVILNNHNNQVKIETIDMVKSLLPQKVSINLTPVAMAAATKDVPHIAPSHFDLPLAGTSAGSGRGYIWEKTIEMIKKKPLLGYGFDTYPYVFPQNDKYKIAGIGSYEAIVSKPHNLFLGMAVNAGIPFLLMFLFLVGEHLFRTIKAAIYVKQTAVKTGIKPDYWQLIMLFFMITFLVQGMVNDSIIATTPIFWVLFGLGVGFNHEVPQKQ